MCPEVAELVATGEVNPYTKKSYSEPDEEDDDSEIQELVSDENTPPTADYETKEGKADANSSKIGSKLFPVFHQSSSDSKLPKNDKQLAEISSPIITKPFAERILNTMQKAIRIETLQPRKPTSSTSHFFPISSSSASVPLKRQATDTSDSESSAKDSQRLKLSQESSISTLDREDEVFSPTVDENLSQLSQLSQPGDLKPSHAISTFRHQLSGFRYMDQSLTNSMPLTPIEAQDDDAIEDSPRVQQESFVEHFRQKFRRKSSFTILAATTTDAVSTSITTGSVSTLETTKMSSDQQFNQCASVVSTEISKKYGATLQEKFGADPDLFGNMFMAPLSSGTTSVSSSNVTKSKRSLGVRRR
jgi:hypothetical protein